MIINFPTALYTTILPQTDASGGNITYTISVSDPPRDFTNTPRIPAAIESRIKSPRLLTASERRARIGDLIFTTSKSSSAYANSGKKHFEVGQVLDFDNIVDSVVDPMVVDDVEIRHDTNRLDYVTIGLTDEQVVKINDDAMLRISALQVELDNCRQQRAEAEVRITEIKKSQNEVQKAIGAIRQLVVTDSSYNSVIATLEANLVVLQSDYDSWISVANVASASAISIRDQILAIAQVVR